MKALTFPITGTLGFDKAVITDGGVVLKEINFKNMTSRIHPNLYILGDVLNINRPSGGFSLQLCWTTGFVAGTDAGKKQILPKLDFSNILFVVRDGFKEKESDNPEGDYRRKVARYVRAESVQYHNGAKKKYGIHRSVFRNTYFLMCPMPFMVSCRTTIAPKPFPKRMSGMESVNAKAPSTPSMENVVSTTSK